MTFDHLVTFARGFFQLASFEHANSSVPARDQPGVLECPDHEGHRRTMDAEHDRKELVLQNEILGPNAVLGL